MEAKKIRRIWFSNSVWLISFLVSYVLTKFQCNPEVINSNTKFYLHVKIYCKFTVSESIKAEIKKETNFDLKL